MKDEDRLIEISKLRKSDQKLLRDREYSGGSISAYELAREFAAWELGDKYWADSILTIYNEAIRISLEDNDD